MIFTLTVNVKDGPTYSVPVTMQDVTGYMNRTIKDYWGTDITFKVDAREGETEPNRCGQCFTVITGGDDLCERCN